VYCFLRETLTNTAASGAGINYDVFDPGTSGGGNTEDDTRQCANDLTAHVGVAS
jgi:hypothetical protein